MQTTLLQMTVLMLCGALWGVFSPNGLNAMQTRLVLTSAVYYFFLPAMILQVLWHADIGWQSLHYSLLACSSIAISIVLSWLLAKLLRCKPAQTGAIILAASYPNVTYLGLPVLEQTFGVWARSVVIQIDLFATAPMVYIIGIMLARHFGESEHEKPKHPLAFLNAPPFWAAFIAVLLNVWQVPAPVWFNGLLEKCSAAVAPMMIFSLGMALTLRALHFRTLPYLLPIVLVKLFAQPYSARYLAGFLDLESLQKAAAVLDIAMPSMIVGIVLCDRYRLDSGLYASAVTVTTALSLISLPFWRQML